MWQWDIYNTMCDNETFNNTMCDNETFEIQCVTSEIQWQWHFKYNVWQWDILKLQCVTQWDILNTMCDNETF